MSNELSFTDHPYTTSLVLNKDAMQNMVRLSEIMASGVATVPKHLQKNQADCLAVIMQATRWGMDCFVVGQKTHLVNGTLGYEAQLVNAVVQSSGAIRGRFYYEYKGQSPNLECRVGAVIAGETEITWGNWLNESRVTTKNSPNWKTNPSQQLGYLQVKNWARLYTPGAILGVYTPDELTAPVNMGAADVVHPAGPEVPAELIERATTAASGGASSYKAFWQSITAAERKLLAPQHEHLKGLAAYYDQQRTIDTPPDPLPATYAQVIDKLQSAKTAEELDLFADEWIGLVPDQEQRKELAGKYDELRSRFAV